MLWLFDDTTVCVLTNFVAPDSDLSAPEFPYMAKVGVVGENPFRPCK